MCATSWPPTCARDTAEVANCPARQQRQWELLGGETSFLSWSFLPLCPEKSFRHEDRVVIHSHQLSPGLRSLPTSMAVCLWYDAPTATSYIITSGIRESPQPHQTSLRLIRAPPYLHHTSPRLIWESLQPRQTSLRLWYGCPHSHVTTSNMGVPTVTLTSLRLICAPQRLRHASLCDSRVPIATSYVSVSLIRASPQLRHTSLCLWFTCPHSYIRCHYVCDSGVPTATL